MSVATQIKLQVAQALQAIYQQSFTPQQIVVNETASNYEGNYTVVLFPLIKELKLSPEVLGNALGNYLTQNNPHLVKQYFLVKGFLNLVVPDSYWFQFLQQQYQNSSYGTFPKTNKNVVVEFSSPNTNKPLHLGHLRNNFLGWSISNILQAVGNTVYKTCVVNDRGIHICKSMVAWQWFAQGATPQSTGIKGDHFVGNYYVKFNEEYQREIQELIQKGYSKEQAEEEAPIMQEARKLLREWENGNAQVLALWKTMNEWVYEGFEETYKRIGVSFNKTYYESNLYMLGKNMVEEGLQKGVFFQKEDGSVWIDLTAEGLDEKLVRRKDGTAVYITQDIGLAQKKYEEFHYNQSIYVVGDEQNYHFKVLKLICEKLNLPAAQGLYHLSYGMVELPEGKMKSREGTVVDADDLLDEMLEVARQKTEELGKVSDFSQEELEQLYHIIGLGALKFFVLRVEPKKKIIFNPQESIDFQGFTASFIQYTHARIQGVLRKATTIQPLPALKATLLPNEIALLQMLEKFPSVIETAALEYNPAEIAVYVYQLCQCYNYFYTAHSVLHAESEEKKQLRLQLCLFTASVISKGMNLLGIEVPARM